MTTTKAKAIPNDLLDHDQWVSWDYRKSKTTGKQTKVPLQPSGSYASSTDPETWCAFTDLSDQYPPGFVFTVDDPFIGIDLDGCRNPETGLLDQWAKDIVLKFGTYAEVSPSGTGVKLWGVSFKTWQHANEVNLPQFGDGYGDKKPSIEVYDCKRYFCVTGVQLQGMSEVVNVDDALGWLIETYFSDKEKSDKTEPDAPLFDGHGRSKEELQTVLKMLLNEEVPPPGENDASQRILLYAGICKRYGVIPSDSVKLIRAALVQSPLPNGVSYSDHGIEKRWHQAEGRMGEATGEAQPRQQSHHGDWDDPIPIEDVTLPRFPVDALPPVLADWIAQQSEATQTPPDMAALLTLATLAATSAKCARVKPWDGWTEPLNLYTATLLGPGNRKTSVFQVAEEPLSELEDELQDACRDEVAAAQTERRQAESRLKKLENAIASGGEPGKAASMKAEARDLAIALASWPQVELPTLITRSPTSQSLEKLLAANDERIGCFNAEGGIFDLMAGKYSQSPTDFDIYLAGHSGDAAGCERVSRDAVKLKSPAITLGLTIQPTVISALASKRSHFIGRGLLARFLYAVPRSPVGERSIHSDSVCEDVHGAYKRLIKTIGRQGGDEVEMLLNMAAQHALEDFATWIEAELGDGCLSEMQEWGSKLAGASVRIAGLITVARNVDEYPFSQVVDEAAMEAAATIGQWAIPHATAALDLLDRDNDTAMSDAKYLLKWIRSGALKSFTMRDARRHGHRRFTSDQHRLDAALKLLEANGHIRRAGIVGIGGKVDFHVNPKI